MQLVREPGVITPALIDLLRGEFQLDWNGAHGVAHWARVRVNGLRLALHNGADMRVVEYFSFLHDACRRNEHRDPGHGQRAAAQKFVEFMRSVPVQQQMQTEMWMYPAEAGVARADVMKFAPEPAAFDTPAEKDLAARGADWVARWTRVLK